MKRTPHRGRWPGRGLPCALLAVACLGPLPAEVPEAEADARSASELIEVLESPGASDPERRAALARLRVLTTGDPEDAETREAAFHLARYLQYREGLRSTETRQAMVLATTQHPDDPRTPEVLAALAPAQADAGEHAGALVSFRRLLAGTPERFDAALLARAVISAAAMNDHAAAFHWSHAIDLSRLRPEQQIPVLLARIESAHGIGRDDLALEAAAEARRRSVESLHVHADALLAAAEAHEATEDLEGAIAAYETFVNVHRQSPTRPAALLALGRVLARAGRLDRAERVLRWLIDDHPMSAESGAARVELIELPSDEATPEKLPAYMAAARETPDGASAQRICDRVLERYIASGHAGDAIAALAELARDPDADGLAPLAARATLRRGIEAVLELLISRDEPVAIAAAASDARSVGIPIPPRQRDAVAAARRSLGLATETPSLVALALEEARPLAAAEDWNGALGRVEDALLLEREPPPETLTEAVLMAAEALWRTARGPEAVERIEQALARPDLPPERRRGLLVLDADIRFAGGEYEPACRGYREAVAISATPWVSRQVQRCAELETATAQENRS